MHRLLFLLLPIGLFSCGTNYVNDLILDQPTSREEILTREKKNGSELSETKYNGVPPKRGLNDTLVYEESIMFIKHDAEPLPLKSKYFYDENGEFKVLLHEWNLATPGLSLEQVDSLMATQDKKMDWYYNEFVEIANQITERIGMPTGGNANVTRENLEIMDFYKSYVEWDQDDRYVILKFYWIPKPGYKIYKIFTTVYFK